MFQAGVCADVKGVVASDIVIERIRRDISPIMVAFLLINFSFLLNINVN
jgi:hypothetical protein